MAGTIGQGETPEKRPVVPYLGAVKVAAVVMAVMIVVGVAVLGVTLAKRLGGAAPAPAVAVGPSDAVGLAGVAPPSAFGEVSLRLPPRARVMDMAMDQRRLVLHLQLAGRDKALMVVDLENGRSLGLIRLEPDPLEP